MECVTSEVTKITVDDVTVMTSWLNIPGKSIMSMMSKILRNTWRHRPINPI